RQKASRKESHGPCPLASCWLQRRVPERLFARLWFPVNACELSARSGMRLRSRDDCARKLITPASLRQMSSEHHLRGGGCTSFHCSESECLRSGPAACRSRGRKGRSVCSDSF